MALHDNLKEARKRKGMSQELVAEQLGISRQAVTKWESGQSKPNSRNLQALAELYEVPAEELLADNGKEEPNLILRVNLIRFAIIAQAAFLHTCAAYAYLLRSHPDDEFRRGALIFALVMLLLASIWMTTNHRYEPDMDQRRKNIDIEFRYCCVQAIIGLLTIHFGLGLVGAVLIITVMLVYILYINPKFMNRKLTR